jgi:16S rRNA processing protein RimM
MPETAALPAAELLIELGRIVNRHGIRGEVRLKPHNPDGSAITALPALLLLRPPAAPPRRRVVAARPHKQFLLVQFDGVTTAEGAEALIGCTVAVARADLPPAGPAAVYHVDLIGCAVRTTAGAALGTVREVIVTGSNDVCVVRDGAREVLIPLVADVIAELDTTTRTIVVHALPGLLDA